MLEHTVKYYECYNKVDMLSTHHKQQDAILSIKSLLSLRLIEESEPTLSSTSSGASWPLLLPLPPMGLIIRIEFWGFLIIIVVSYTPKPYSKYYDPFLNPCSDPIVTSWLPAWLAFQQVLAFDRLLLHLVRFESQLALSLSLSHVFCSLSLSLLFSTARGASLAFSPPRDFAHRGITCGDDVMSPEERITGFLPPNPVTLNPNPPRRLGFKPPYCRSRPSSAAGVRAVLAPTRWALRFRSKAHSTT